MPNQTSTNQSLYFPPPPTSVIKDTDAKRNLKFNFTKSKTTASSTVTELQKPPKPILKKKITSTKRTRQWNLLGILLISFTILILSTIFAYCAALPHSDNIQAAQAAAASSSPASAPITSTVSLISVSTTTETPASTAASTDTTARMLSRDAPIYTDPQSQSVEAALAEDASNQKAFSTPSAMAALTFYTATLPFLTMLHTSVELFTSLIRPETSQATRLGDALRFRRAGADVDAQGVVTRRRVGTLLSFSASVLLCLGWVVMQSFWLNCEITTFGDVSAEQVCPIQIRGHRMGGVSELSVVKVVLGFVVVLGYAGYALYLVKAVGVFARKSSSLGPVRLVSESGNGSRMGSFRRRARFARGGGVDTDGKKGDVESVVIAIEVDKDMR